MAIWSFPFQSVGGDRVYSDVDFATFYDSLFTDGVFTGLGEGLEVIEADTPAMAVKVKTGAAFIQGRQLLNDAELELTVNVASSTQDRTDLVVAKLDLVAREITLEIKMNTETLQRDDNVHELQLAELTIPANSVVVRNGNIRDTRADRDVCGYSAVHGELNLESLQNQYESMLSQAYDVVSADMDNSASTLSQFLTDQQASFQAWFDGLQNTLDTNQLTNLNGKIDSITPEYHLSEIQHNLNEYPLVRIMAWEYGLGLTGLGNEPSGSFGGTIVHTVASAAEYTNRQAVVPMVPYEYFMATPALTKVNDREYLFTEGYKTIQVNLIGGM